MTPLNGLYLTHEDFPSYSDDFIKQYCILHPECSGQQLCKSVTFCVTERCNLACTYCYETHKTPKRMTWETAKKIVDNIFCGEFIGSDVKAIVLDFIGGEPLLEIDLIDKICDYFKEKAFELNSPLFYYSKFSISTNGVLFNDPKVQRFIKKNIDRLSISISIDGDKKLHDACRVFHDGTGSYDIVSKSAKELLKLYPTTSTKVTIAPENLVYLFEAVKHLHNEIGYKAIFANCVFENVWNNTHPAVLYSQLVKLSDWIIDNEIYTDLYISLFDEKYIGEVTQGRIDDLKKHAYCGGNGQMVAYGVDGRVYPCVRYMKHSLNNYPERPMGDIYTGKYTDTVRRKWFDDLCGVTTWSSADNECKQCSILPFCTTCVAHQYDATGTPNCKTKYHCGVTKAIVAANYYYWEKLYKKLNLNTNIHRLLPVMEYERGVSYEK